MPEPPYDDYGGPDGPLGRLLREARESAFRREKLLEAEKELILKVCEELKSYGFSPADSLVQTLTAEEGLRAFLKLDKAAPPPPVEKMLPFIGGEYHLLCRWPGSDFMHAASVLFQLSWLRQQNAPWLGRGHSIHRDEPAHPEEALFDPNASDELWKLRLIAGANRASKERWATKEDLDRLTEALRFNAGKTGRRTIRTDDFFVDTKLYLTYLAFHNILKKAQREIPKKIRDEEAIGKALSARGFPAFFLERLAQELAEHRRRHAAAGIKLTLQDRAALLLVDLEGRRGNYGLPEVLPTSAVPEEDVSKTVIVATRRPPIGAFESPAAEKKYGIALKKTIAWARGRVRQLKATWNSGFVAPKSVKK
jgi:hypothetical protein